MTQKEIIRHLELIEASAKLLMERSYTVKQELLRIYGGAPRKGSEERREKRRRFEAETIADLHKRLIKN